MMATSRSSFAMSTASISAAASAPTCPLMIGNPYTRALGLIGRNNRLAVSVRVVVVRLPSAISTYVIERYGLWSLGETFNLENISRNVELTVTSIALLARGW